MITEVLNKHNIIIIRPEGMMMGPANIAIRERTQTEIDNHSEPPSIIFNLEDVVRMDSSGLGILISIHEIVRRKGGRTAIVKAGKQIKNLLLLGKLSTFFESYESETDAIQALKGELHASISPINNTNVLQLSDEDKLRIGIAWDALSPNSRRAYQLVWRSISEWLQSQSFTLDTLTDVHLAGYLSSLDTQGVAPATLSMCLAAVKWYFSNVRAVDVQFPISQKRLSAIRRDAKGRGRGQVDGLTWADVERVCAFAESENTIAGYRDSAMIRLMSDCLLRVSEVVAVNVGHFKQNTLVVQRSKTDQEGAGVALYVTSDTRKAIKRYREKSDIHRGALFRPIRRGDHIQSGRLTDVSARRIIKQRASDAGVDGFISGHSLRVGSAVSLAKAGASVVDLQVAGRWKNSQMPAHYARAEMAERGAIARFKEKRKQ